MNNQGNPIDAELVTTHDIEVSLKTLRNLMTIRIIEAKLDTKVKKKN